jgi:hypothetical protein
MFVILGSKMLFHAQGADIYIFLSQYKMSHAWLKWFSIKPKREENVRRNAMLLFSFLKTEIL